MTKPKITREQAFKIAADFFWKAGEKYYFFTENQDKYPVHIIAFRGYYQDTMGAPGVNDRGIYDDCICVVTPDRFYTFNANTDPSVVRNGIATLVPGVHLYKKGLHGITKKNPYPAFRPATPNEVLPVTRDGKPGFSQGVAINIHRGGYKNTSSEGCQTIPPGQWVEFQPLVYDLMDQYNQKTIPYVLIVWEQ
jgi:hypothetical protein